MATANLHAALDYVLTPLGGVDAGRVRGFRTAYKAALEAGNPILFARGNETYVLSDISDAVDAWETTVCLHVHAFDATSNGLSLAQPDGRGTETQQPHNAGHLLLSNSLSKAAILARVASDTANVALPAGNQALRVAVRQLATAIAQGKTPALPFDTASAARATELMGVRAQGSYGALMLGKPLDELTIGTIDLKNANAASEKALGPVFLFRWCFQDLTTKAGYYLSEDLLALSFYQRMFYAAYVDHEYAKARELALQYLDGKLAIVLGANILSFGLLVTPKKKGYPTLHCRFGQEAGYVRIGSENITIGKGGSFTRSSVDARDNAALSTSDVSGSSSFFMAGDEAAKKDSLLYKAIQEDGYVADAFRRIAAAKDRKGFEKALLYVVYGDGNDPLVSDENYGKDNLVYNLIQVAIAPAPEYVYRSLGSDDEKQALLGAAFIALNSKEIQIVAADEYHRSVLYPGKSAKKGDGVTYELSFKGIGNVADIKVTTLSLTIKDAKTATWKEFASEIELEGDGTSFFSPNTRHFFLIDSSRSFWR